MEALWLVSGLLAAIISLIYIKRKWGKLRWHHSITVPILYVLGPLGLLFICVEMWGNRPLPSPTKST